MKAYWGSGGIFHAFLTSALDGWGISETHDVSAVGSITVFR
jgi:hypothetical protein